MAICLLFGGCATVPGAGSLPLYEINGAAYVALDKLCRQSAVELDYDTLTRIITLTGDMHRVNLMTGETLMLVDGEIQHLKHPVDIYQGAVVVPYKFKEQVFDTLFQKPAGEKPAAVPLKIKKIVIDAGHGGRDPGAIGRSGIKEKYVNLDISNRLANLLRAKGIDVVMTRSSDTFVSLPQRVDIANDSGAGLFVSIHSNANRVRSLSGLEVYYVSFAADDLSRAISTAKSANLAINKDYFYQMTPELEVTLWDMIYASNRAESVALAGHICCAAGRQLEAKVLGTKGAKFVVLKGCRMPAVLVETGFLSNKKEELLLRNAYYRQQIAETIAQGILDYDRELAIMEAVK